MESGSVTLERQVATLRTELKAWEAAFARANGRKAGRDDIDASAMADKYREFHRLRRPIDKPLPAKAETPRKPRHLRQPSSNRKRGALRERPGNEVSTTPNKAFKSLEVVHEEQELEPTPAFIRCALGPTPQKDGQVLGIFDMATSATPSKSGDGSKAIAAIITDTPSKPTAPPSTSKRALSATPQSSSKRRLLDAFAGTPVKRQRLDDAQTPSTAKHYFATPTFLRRSFPLAPVDEDPAPMPRKRGLVRSLSSIIQGLRKHEDKRMDDDWDIMNEMEAGGDDDQQTEAPRVLVEDSQAAEMPLGPDQGIAGSEDEDGNPTELLGADGKPRKAWKKRGLKRQTKRSNMKPVLHKPKKADELEVVEEATEGDQEEAVAETQVVEPEGDEDERTAKRRKALAGGDVVSTDMSNDKGPKKVKAAAHANFRRLNIKNKNSKANGKGGGKRFGRR
ncbi:hypothetical protein LTR53_008745 [Teratosphaeriaceae sp. CCFEE 6253]|nr:hypothetical protein LTR53_008745 [Teratosphaeriaceae sp. CCFEE 6253]